MDFAEQNPRAGTLARPYDYFIDTLQPTPTGVGFFHVRSIFVRVSKKASRNMTFPTKVLIPPQISRFPGEISLISYKNMVFYL